MPRIIGTGWERGSVGSGDSRRLCSNHGVVIKVQLVMLSSFWVLFLLHCLEAYVGSALWKTEVDEAGD